MQRWFSYHHLLGAFLLLAFLAQHFSANLIVIDYILRTDAYASQCLNKARPALKCKGKCQMMRKMAEQEKQSPVLPESPTSFKLNIWCQALHEEVICIDPPILSAEPAWAQHRQYLIPTQTCLGIFHPPRLMV
ncbi:MAG: hypothetical protein WBP58_00420 [Chitinophagaceae bacterium]